MLTVSHSVPGRRLAIGVVALAGLLGCAEGESARALESSVDTVGGTVYVHYTGHAPEWRLEPILELGGVGGLNAAPSPAEFARITRVESDEDGRIYVADQTPPEIRVFGADGAYLETLVRKGAGPAEAGGLHGMGWLARDTLLVADYGNARLTQVTRAGEQTGQWGWLPITGASKDMLVDAGAGEVYAIVALPRDEQGLFRTGWGRFRLHHPPDTLSRPTPESLGVELPENGETCRGNRMIGFMSNPYGPLVLAAPAPGLERVVALNTEYRVAFIDPRGDTTRVIARDVQPVPLPDTARERYQEELDAFRTRYRGAACEGTIAETDVLPVLRDLYFDHDGRLLVEYNRENGPAFDLFDRDGAWLATFPAPQRDRKVPPYLFGDRLYAVTRDSLDVQRVVVYRVSASGG